MRHIKLAGVLVTFSQACRKRWRIGIEFHVALERANGFVQFLLPIIGAELVDQTLRRPHNTTVAFRIDRDSAFRTPPGHPPDRRPADSPASANRQTQCASRIVRAQHRGTMGLVGIARRVPMKTFGALGGQLFWAAQSFPMGLGVLALVAQEKNSAFFAPLVREELLPPDAAFVAHSCGWAHRDVRLEKVGAGDQRVNHHKARRESVCNNAINTTCGGRFSICGITPSE